jgi:hypothetical protein
MQFYIILCNIFIPFYVYFILCNFILFYVLFLYHFMYILFYVILYYSMYRLCVYVYKSLPPGVYPIAVDKYINIKIIVKLHINSYNIYTLNYDYNYKLNRSKAL